MKVVTVTLCPAFDIHCYCEGFMPYHENSASITSRDAGGKGINVSRALLESGIDSTAVVVLGEENKQDFSRKLMEYGLRVSEITVGGRIRENITLHTEGKDETRISFRGFGVDGTLATRVRDAILNEGVTGGIVCFCGRLPDGLGIDTVKSMIAELRGLGVRVVVDSKSFSLDDLVECRPWLIKPNGEEIREYTGRAVDSPSDAASVAESLRVSGIDNVMITLGGDGAVLATSDGIYKANSPRVGVRSTVGAGDSAIGGFISAICRGGSYSDALGSAVAFGSAACMSDGTQPPSADAIGALIGEVSVLTVR